MAKDESRHHILEIMIHIMAWMVIFFFPQMMFVREEGFVGVLSHAMPLLVSPALLAIVFYVNYIWLVPKYLRNHNLRRFVMLNLILIIAAQTVNGFWNYSWQMRIERIQIDKWESEGMADSLLLARYQQVVKNKPRRDSVEPQSQAPRSYVYDDEEFRASREPGCYDRMLPESGRRHWRFFGATKGKVWIDLVIAVRDFMVYLLLVVLAVVLHMSFRFRKANMARKQAELRQTETELQSLKNQVSPHFLLNTLNNIYALVVFDQGKAQEAIMNLSRLLSHMLYQNRDAYTTLEREVDFLRRYVDLMRLRISPSVRVEFVDNMRESGSLLIAPLILISLVENAFKHGISGNEGYVSIHITGSVDSGIIHADIRNSNHPKSTDDKSGHGVGLQLVRRRLELLYPGKFSWEQGVDDNNEYYSLLTIYTR